MNVLVTGAAGFIGFHLSQSLIQKGYNVIGLDNINDYYSQSLKLDRLKILGVEVDVLNLKDIKYINGNFTFIYGDISSKDIWDYLKPFKINKVIHLAAQAGVRFSLTNPDSYIISNVVGFQNVLNFCFEQNINDLLYASSSSVYGKNSVQPFLETEDCNEPESLYAATKKFNELSAFTYYKTKSISSIGMRFFTVYGPWGRPDMAPMLFADAAINNREISVFNNGNQKRDFTYIDDIINGIILLLEKICNKSINGAEVLNIGKGNPESLLRFIELIEINLNKKIKKKFVNEQPGDVAVTFADITKLNNYISFIPHIKLEEGLKAFTEWYLKYYKNK
jgi:UDP-glucuronate 4-epimerase